MAARPCKVIYLFKDAYQPNGITQSCYFDRIPQVDEIVYLPIHNTEFKVKRVVHIPDVGIVRNKDNEFAALIICEEI